MFLLNNIALQKMSLKCLVAESMEIFCQRGLAYLTYLIVYHSIKCNFEKSAISIQYGEGITVQRKTNSV